MVDVQLECCSRPAQCAAHCVALGVCGHACAPVLTQDVHSGNATNGHTTETVLKHGLQSYIVCDVVQVPGDCHPGCSDDVCDLLEAGPADERNTALHAPPVQGLCT